MAQTYCFTNKDNLFNISFTLEENYNIKKLNDIIEMFKQQGFSDNKISEIMCSLYNVFSSVVYDKLQEDL